MLREDRFFTEIYDIEKSMKKVEENFVPITLSEERKKNQHFKLLVFIGGGGGRGRSTNSPCSTTNVTN